jgi:hypothetical protein
MRQDRRTHAAMKPQGNAESLGRENPDDKLRDEGISTEIMLAQKSLKGPPFFSGGFGRVGNVSSILGKQLGEIASLKCQNRSALRIA